VACAIGNIAKRTSRTSRWEEPDSQLANFNGGFLRFANGHESSAPALRDSYNSTISSKEIYIYIYIYAHYALHDLI